MKLTLASASPRRAEILRNAGFDFDVYPAHVDESRLPQEHEEDHDSRLDSAKPLLIARRIVGTNAGAIVIGADTVVLSNEEILGKPKDADDARRMLRLLSGTAHDVLTGLSMIRVPDGPEYNHVETTNVQFLKLSKSDIDEYIATGESFDKAGAYGIQGIGGRFIWKIEGCYFNVMGLPLSRLWLTLNLFQNEHSCASGDCF